LPEAEGAVIPGVPSLSMETKAITRQVIECLINTYHVDRDTVVDSIQVSVEEVKSDPKADHEEDKPAQDPDDSSEQSDKGKLIAEILGNSGESNDSDVEKDPKDDAPKESTQERIHKRKGSQQFISLCDDICKMAPKYRERKLQGVFCSKSYVFSIDSGCGLSSTLELFSKLLKEEGIFKAKKTIEVTTSNLYSKTFKLYKKNIESYGSC